ncbi:MAG: glycosyltransferase family 2 protein [Burkholderiaceae bacterium]|nr:glycosyltransferase family 2 protein [Burkholderiaceae bacterium]
MCTYEGEKYLAEQLSSFAAQTYADWRLYVSDDGSRDATRMQLADFFAARPSHAGGVFDGPQRGFSRNFLSLMCREDIEGDLFAPSDQDDVWEPEKLARAVAWIRTIPAHVPALYCSRTELVDEAGRPIGFSTAFNRPPTFANALVQNIGGGNTMMFNAAARDCLRLAGADLDVVAHDWWAYIVITACGGKVHYDGQPTLRYRQHGANLIGASSGMAARRRRIRMLFQGSLRQWTDVHLQALEPVRPHMTRENLQVLDAYAKARQQPVFGRVTGLWRSKVHRQTLLGNTGLLAAALLNKI